MDQKFEVLKRNRRICIVDNNDRVVYSPPDFVRLISRDDLRGVADIFNSRGYDIGAIIELESNIRFRPDYKRNKACYYETVDERCI